MTNAQNRFADALGRVLPTTLASHLEFRGWICQETWCDRSSVTFDLTACRRNSTLKLTIPPTPLVGTAHQGGFIILRI